MLRAVRRIDWARGGRGSMLLTCEEEVDVVEGVVADAARLELQLRLRGVGDEVGEDEERDHALELSGLV
jgi:hypothetical protein